MSEDALRYSRQYHHSFQLGGVLQVALGVAWYVTGSIAFGVLSGLNVIAILLVYPFLLTVLANLGTLP